MQGWCGNYRMKGNGNYESYFATKAHLRKRRMIEMPLF